MAVSKRTRYEVLRRDNFTCRYCRSADGELTVDHVTPVALGGTDDPTNLVACCKDCNAGKTSTSPEAQTVADVAEDALRWSKALQRAGEILAERADERDLYLGAFFDAWPQYRYLPSDFESTLIRLYESGLPESVMVDAAKTAAHAKGVWDRPAYFAGICWKRVRAMREIAEQIIDSEGD
jgi:hypothetical protein